MRRSHGLVTFVVFVALAWVLRHELSHVFRWLGI